MHACFNFFYYGNSRRSKKKVKVGTKKCSWKDSFSAVTAFIKFHCGYHLTMKLTVSVAENLADVERGS